MAYVIYLRKSRKDMEAEAFGEGETLARHEAVLTDYAQKQRLPVADIYREIVSGETIAARPVMQRLLSEVEAGGWEGVLVMEVERLARGDTIDQGIVAQAFKFSNTKIITPAKTYDPSNEYDEEYFEFGLFMSRREYKTINRRLQNGRLISSKEGKFVGNRPPFGYQRVKLEREKGFTLTPDEKEADIVRLIFDYYTKGQPQPDGNRIQMGSSHISNYLNSMSVPSPSGRTWTSQAVTEILRNPVYIGKIKWGSRSLQKQVKDGAIQYSRPRTRPEELTLYDGLHPALVSEETYRTAQEIRSSHTMHRTPVKYVVKNPLSGLVLCMDCGRKMVRRPVKEYDDLLMCPQSACKNVSSQLYLVEKAVLNSLESYLQELRADVKGRNRPTDSSGDALEKQLADRQKELQKVEMQIESLYDFLEQGIYTKEVFLSRNKTLDSRKKELSADVASLEQQLAEWRQREQLRSALIPRIEAVLAEYPQAADPEHKNALLKSVIRKVYYKKEKGGRWGDPSDFSVKLIAKV